MRLQDLRQHVRIEAENEWFTADSTQIPPTARSMKGFGTIQGTFMRVGESADYTARATAQEQ